MVCCGVCHRITKVYAVVHSDVLIPLCAHSIVCRQLVTYDGGSQWGVDTPVCPQHCMPPIGQLSWWFTVRCWYPCAPTALYAAHWSLMTVVHSEVLIPLCVHNIVCRPLVSYPGGSLWGVDTPVHPQHCMPPIGHLWRWFTVRCWYPCVSTTLYAAHWSLMTVVHSEVLIPLCTHSIVCRPLITCDVDSLWGVDTPVHPQHCMPPIGHLWRWFTLWGVDTPVHPQHCMPPIGHLWRWFTLWGVDTPVCPQHCMPPIGQLSWWFTVRCWYLCAPTALYAAHWSLMTVVHTVRCWYPCAPTALYAAHWSLMTVVHSEVLIPLCTHSIVCRQLVTYDGGSHCEVLIPLCTHSIVCRPLVTYDGGSQWGVDTPVCPQHCMPPVGHLWRWFQGGCTCA